MKMRTVMLVTATVFLGIAAQTVQAQESPVNSRLRKLGRGLSNIATGFVELPRNIRAVQKDDGDMAAVTYGTLRGLWRFGVREVVGVGEVVTFPMTNKPVVEPEFVVDDGLVDAIFRPDKQSYRAVSTDWTLRAPTPLDD